MRDSPHATPQEHDIRLLYDLIRQLASGAQRPRNNELSDSSLKELIALIRQPRPEPVPLLPPVPPPPPPPVVVPVTPPTSKGPRFENSTKDPRKPGMYVPEELWTLIGGERFGDEENRPIGRTITLGTSYLSRQGDNQFSHVVRAVVEAAVKYAEDSLGSIDRGRYEPQIVRQLQLASRINRRIGVPLNGRWCYGILQGFTEPDDTFYSKDEYQLDILLDRPRDGLSLIKFWVPQGQWLQGSALVRFDTELSEKDDVVIDDKDVVVVDKD